MDIVIDESFVDALMDRLADLISQLPPTRSVLIQPDDDDDELSALTDPTVLVNPAAPPPPHPWHAAMNEALDAGPDEVSAQIRAFREAARRE